MKVRCQTAWNIYGQTLGIIITVTDSASYKAIKGIRTKLSTGLLPRELLGAAILVKMASSEKEVFSEFWKYFKNDGVKDHVYYGLKGLECLFYPSLISEIPNPWDEPNAICCAPSVEIIISKKMKDNGIVIRKSDPGYLKCFYMKVIGDFECVVCGSKWKCYNATIVIDLSKLEISKKYKQKTGCCEESCGHPYFTNKQFDRIADRVISYYKKRKEAGGTVPAIENNGSYSRKAFTAHEGRSCERCRELDEPCWLHLVPYIKKIPYEMANLVRSSLTNIDEQLKKLHASAIMEVNGRSKLCRINVNPLSGSKSIKQWRKQCETLVESFLQNFSAVSLIQPGFSKITIHPKLSVLTEPQTVLYVTGDKKKVGEVFKRIESTAKEIKQQHEAGKRKPCIIIG